ncbi:MAG: hypothetical protein KJ718_03355 [Nanoarchaeota archaeon]|nr:hypothetical protein [Nanoarchaeota archaeon]MBU1051566.1 hypothetical protein [Nanoarchaeota archaeon]
MATIDEIKRMQKEGKSEQEIISGLKSKGVPENEIINTMVQSKIKDAVSYDSGNVPNPGENQDGLNVQTEGPFDEGAGADMPDFPQQLPEQVQEFSQEQPLPGTQMQGLGPGAMDQENNATEYPGPGSGEYSGMQQSMLSQGQLPQQEGEYFRPEGGEQAMQQEYGEGVYKAGAGEDDYQDSYGGMYPQYQPYQEAMSSDVITEISEQVVSERLSVLQDKLEKVIDMRTVFEANIFSLGERLQRMEKIIDKLQLSILQKVGEYMTDVKDVKKELEETQKSFGALRKKKGSGKHGKRHKK